MHLHIEGSGPPLVLLHGWAMHAGVYAPLLRELTPHFECHLIDLPGHGRSEERFGMDFDETIERLLALLPVAPWIGWSLGGLIALGAALRAPDRVRSLTMLAASPRFVIGADWPHAVERAVFEDFARDLGSHYARTIERFLMLEVHGDEHAREELRWLRARLCECPPPDPQVLGDGLAILSATDLRAELRALRVASLWLAGQRDRLVPWRGMQAAAGLAPNARFRRIDHAGHAPFLAQPKQVADALRSFL